MSSLEDRMRANTDTAYAETFAGAMESIRAERLRQEASGYAWMSAAMGYGEAAEGPSRFGKIARGSKWFVIWFAMVLPCLLVIHVAF